MNKRGKFYFVLGGARSGKSSFAEKLAKRIGKPVSYIATAVVTDQEMQERIDRHRASRPAEWKTIEVGDNPQLAMETLDSAVDGTILMDCLTVFLTNLMFTRELPGCDESLLSCSVDLNPDIASRERALLDQITRLAEKARRSHADVIIVSNEVGSGVVPPTELGREFRDVMGRANQIAASMADEVFVVFAGIPVNIKKLMTAVKDIELDIF